AAPFDYLQYGAVYALGASPAPEAEGVLVAALVAENARNVRSEILRALAQRRDRAAVPAISQQLSDPDPRVITMARSALSQLDARSGLRSVLPLLRHQDTSVRQMATGFILKFGDEKAADVMRALFAGDDPAVKQTAIAYLARHGDASDLPLFEAHMA